MQIDLTGKRAIVTGSTVGIGHAIALGLARSGAEVVVNGRGETKVQRAVESIRKSAPKAKVDGLAGDLGTAAGIDAFLNQAGEADILVNNLGIFEPKPFSGSRATICRGCWRRTGAASSSSRANQGSTSQRR